MSHGSGFVAKSRRPQIECCEPRVVLAGNAFADAGATAPLIGPSQLDPLSTADTLRQFLQATDRDYIRETYGLTGVGQTVVVIDSGIAYDHPALGGGLGPSYRIVGGWDFAENDPDPYDDAPGGFHGTHLAGIIGSSDTTYPGLAPEVDLVALRVFSDTGSSNYDWVEDALGWVQQHHEDFEHPVTTVNISIGTSWNSDQVPRWGTLEDELRELEKLGIFVSVAAGNNFSLEEGTGLNYPAASPYVVPVGSVDVHGQISGFSQRTDRFLTAPGESVTSTVPDYLYGFDGVTDDFALASGTSMAAPYVAGASVLLRQAMEITGVGDVNQDILNDHLRASADLIHDTVTDTEYFRINLRNAVDLLMADDFGSTPDTAHPLPPLGAEANVSGHLRSLTDVDYFTFIADRTGVVRMDLHTSEHLSAEFFVVGAQGEETSMELLAVSSGETYTVGVRSSLGLGDYDLKLVTEHSVEADLGRIDFLLTTFQIGQSGRGQLQFAAAHDGWMTITAPAGNHQARLSLLDSAGIRLATSDVGASSPTVTLRVDAGQALQLHVDTGNAADLELRFTNLVNQVDNQIVVHGTAGDDRFVFQAGPTHLLVVNGQTYRLDSSPSYAIRFAGREGEDRVIWFGSDADDTAVLSGTTASLRSTDYALSADDVEDVSVRGGLGEDDLVVHDSPGNDLVVATNRVTTLRTDAAIARAFQFERVVAHASTGQDRMVYRVGAAGEPLTFIANGTQASLETETGKYAAVGFHSVTAYGRGEGSYAELSDAPGRDRFIGRPDRSTLFSEDTRIMTRDFCEVRVTSTHAGEDVAILYDSQGNDLLRMTPDQTSFHGDSFSYHVDHFSSVRVISDQGGTDQATMQDGAGDDRLVSRDRSSYLKGNGYLNYAAGFAQVRVLANAGGSDRALLLDLTSVETLFATEALAGRTSLENHSVEVEGFASVVARYAAGQTPHREIDAVDFVLLDQALS